MNRCNMCVYQTGFGNCRLYNDEENNCKSNNHYHLVLRSDQTDKNCEWCLFQNELGYCMMSDADTKLCIENDLCHWKKYEPQPRPETQPQAKPQADWQTHTFRLNDGQVINVSTNGLSVRVASLNHIFAELTLVEDRNYIHPPIPEYNDGIFSIEGHIEIGDQQPDFIAKDEMEI